jgi:hypothetical protein
MNLAEKVWDWFKKEFIHVTQTIAPLAVAVTQQIKLVAESPVTGVLAAMFDRLENTHGVAIEVLATVKNSIVKALTIELALELPASGDITSDEFLAWESKVMDALNVSKDKSVIWSRVSATIIRDYQAFTQDGSAVTFAEAVQMANDVYLSAEGQI